MNQKDTTRPRVSAYEDVSLGDLGLDCGDNESDCSILRTTLCRELGYGIDWCIHNKIQYIWQTNLEIETVG